jgi:hypothetical protein
MDAEIAEKLHQLGFRRSKNGNGEHTSWSQLILVGNAKTVLCIREFGVGLQYRFLVANASKERDQEQWLDAYDITSAIYSLNATSSMWQRTMCELEGRCVRRTWRVLVGQHLSRVHGWLLASDHGIRRATGKEVN